MNIWLAIICLLIVGICILGERLQKRVEMLEQEVELLKHK